MHVRFADADERFIQEEVSRGFYVNETELVRDAVRRLREQRQKISPFQAAVMRGVEDIQAGRLGHGKSRQTLSFQRSHPRR
jgi:antitoxin ParD1/3/4